MCEACEKIKELDKENCMLASHPIFSYSVQNTMTKNNKRITKLKQNCICKGEGNEEIVRRT